MPAVDLALVAVIHAAFYRHQPHFATIQFTATVRGCSEEM